MLIVRGGQLDHQPRAPAMLTNPALPWVSGLSGLSPSKHKHVLLYTPHKTLTANMTMYKTQPKTFKAWTSNNNQHQINVRTLEQVEYSAGYLPDIKGAGTPCCQRRTITLWEAPWSPTTSRGKCETRPLSHEPSSA